MTGPEERPSWPSLGHDGAGFRRASSFLAENRPHRVRAGQHGLTLNVGGRYNPFTYAPTTQWRDRDGKDSSPRFAPRVRPGLHGVPLERPSRKTPCHNWLIRNHGLAGQPDPKPKSALEAWPQASPKTMDPRTSPRFGSYAAFLALTVIAYVAIYASLLIKTDGFPFVMDNNESFSSLWHAHNLYTYDFSESWGLTDEACSRAAKRTPTSTPIRGTFRGCSLCSSTSSAPRRSPLRSPSPRSPSAC